MNKNTEFKIYKYGKLDIKDAIAKELRIRASIFAEGTAEIGKIVLSNFDPRV